MEDVGKHDFRERIKLIGQVYREFSTNKNQFIRKIISGEFWFELKNPELPEMDQVVDGVVKDLLKTINTKITPRKYRCRVRIGKSSNIYVFRDLDFITK
jgi:hypothetical protein